MDNDSVERHRQELQQLSEQLQALKQIVTDAMSDAQQGYEQDILPKIKETEAQALRSLEAGEDTPMDRLARVNAMYHLRAELCIKNWEMFQNLSLAISAVESLWKRRLTASTVVTSLTDLMRNMGDGDRSSFEEYETASQLQQLTEKAAGPLHNILSSVTDIVTDNTVDEFSSAPELSLESHPKFETLKNDFKNLISERRGATETH